MYKKYTLKALGLAVLVSSAIASTVSVFVAKSVFSIEYTSIPNFTFKNLSSEQVSSICAKSIDVTGDVEVLIESSEGQPISDRLLGCLVAGKKVTYSNIDKSTYTKIEFSIVNLVSLDEGNLIVDESSKSEVEILIKKRSLINAMSIKGLPERQVEKPIIVSITNK